MSTRTQDSAGDAAVDPYRQLFERSADAILIIEDDTFVDCNQATVAMLRYETRERILDTHPSQLSPPFQPDGRHSYEKANAMMALAFENGSHRFEWDHLRADGEVFPVEVLLTAVPSAGKRVLHVVWRDISERKRLEQAVRQSQKMEALGLLAGGIAHDFNNILVAIIGNAELLSQTVEHDANGVALVDQILAAAARATSLTRQLLTFSRHHGQKIVVIDARAVLIDIEKMLRRLIGEDLHLTVRTGAEPLWVRLGDGHLDQVVVNLVTNARDATPSHGRVVVSLKRVTLSDEPPAARLGLAPGRYALLMVTDDGGGMSAETQQRAFDPFFTTKDVGQGTGLGLATVYAIATRAGGAAEIDSALGRGTSIRVYFPLTSEPPPRSDAPTPAAAALAETGTILVAEDAPDVAAVVGKTLEQAGYRVIVASDGVLALERWRAHRGEVSLVLSDVVMPRLGGVALAEALRAEGYVGPVLFVSGHTTPKEDPRLILPEFDLLEKPFAMRALVDRVRALLRPR